MRLFVVNNTSSPPVTQMNDHNFEFFLPAGRKDRAGSGQAPNGQPIAAEAVPQAEKNRYAIAFPLRPGETQFQLEFTLPYTGTIKIDPKPLYPAEHLVVVLPKTMQFAGDDSSAFNPCRIRTRATARRGRAASEARPDLGSPCKALEPSADTQRKPASGAAAQAVENENPRRNNGPGGGLGVPIDAPDALEKYRWPILGVFVVLLAIGGWIVTKRQSTFPPRPDQRGSAQQHSPRSARRSDHAPEQAQSL